MVTKPLIQVGAEALTNSWKNVKFEAINSNSLSTQYSPLVSFGIKKPLLTPIPFTPTLTLDLFEVLTFNNQLSPSGTQAGRVMDISYVPDLVNEDPLDPSVNQVVIKNSKFEAVKSGGDGAFAELDLNNIKMSMDTNSFKNIESTAASSYGIINAKAIGSLVLNSVTATGLKNQVNEVATLGGGRFFYLNQPALPFNLEIKGTTNFICSTNAYSMDSTEQKNIEFGKYTAGSLI